MGLTQKLGTIPLAIQTDSSNNVGIGGAANASFKLAVTGASLFSGALTATGSYISNVTNGYGLRLNRAAVTNFNGISHATGGVERWFVGMRENLSSNNYVIYNEATGADAFTISTSNNNIGIGTSSPTGRLMVYQGTAGNVFTSVVSPQGGSTQVGINFAPSMTDTEFASNPAQASIYATDSNFGANIIFANKTTGAIGNSLTERMRILPNGDVGINGWVSTVKLAVFGSPTSTDYAFIAYTSNGFGILTARNNGNVTVLGALSKGSGSFKIEHPLESMKDTHNLVHSFVESPQANNIYRGKVQLINGKAEVNLDEVSTMTEGTFVLLNRDIHTYTSNETDWDAVRGKVDGNILTIECENNESTAIISWLVIGERQDKHMMDTDWTDENGRVIVEPLKEEVPKVNPLENK